MILHLFHIFSFLLLTYFFGLILWLFAGLMVGDSVTKSRWLWYLSIFSALLGFTLFFWILSPELETYEETIFETGETIRNGEWVKFERTTTYYFEEKE